MAHRVSKYVEHELQNGSVTAKCYMCTWATDRKSQKISHVHFCPACNVNFCVSCHKFLRKSNKFLGKKMELFNKILEE